MVLALIFLSALSSAIRAVASSASVSASATKVAVDEAVIITYTVSSTGGDFFEAWLIRDSVAGIDVCSVSECSVEESWSAPGTHTYKVEVREFDQTTGQSSIAATSGTISVTWAEAVPLSPTLAPTPSATSSPPRISTPSPSPVQISSSSQGGAPTPPPSSIPAVSASPEVAPTSTEVLSSPEGQSSSPSAGKASARTAGTIPGLPLIAGTVAAMSGGTILWWTLWPPMGDIPRRKSRHHRQHAGTLGAPQEADVSAGKDVN